MMSDEMVSVLRALWREISACRREREIHKLLEVKLGGEANVVIQGKKFPRVEIDVLVGRTALEVKLNRSFHEGIGQAFALSVLYGYDTYLVHVYDVVDERLLNAFDCLKGHLPFKVIVMRRTDGRIWCYG